MCDGGCAVDDGIAGVREPKCCSSAEFGSQATQDRSEASVAQPRTSLGQSSGRLITCTSSQADSEPLPLGRPRPFWLSWFLVSRGNGLAGLCLIPLDILTCARELFAGQCHGP